MKLKYFRIDVLKDIYLAAIRTRYAGINTLSPKEGMRQISHFVKFANDGGFQTLTVIMFS